MTIEEIFSKLITHMEEGVAYHAQMAKAYDFIGLWGFSKCQLYHQIEELNNKMKLEHYYATHYFKLIQLENFIKPEIIPSTWFKYSTQSIDIGTKRSIVKDLVTKWVEWERTTKKLYQEMRHELEVIGEYDAAQRIEICIHDVSHELHNVEKLLLKLDSIGYDFIIIEEWSTDQNKKYKKKLGW